MCGASVVVAGGLSFVVAAAAQFAAARAPADLQTRLMISTAMVAQWIMLIYAVSPYNDGQYMLDVHMLFFIMMGAFVAYICPITVLFADTIVFFHHLIFNFVMPQLIWPVGTITLGHFLLHCLMAVVTTAISVSLALAVRRSGCGEM